VLRSAKEKFCSDVQSRSVASSSNAKMLSTVQLSAVAPTLRKRRENVASPKSILDGQKFISCTSTKITDYFHKVIYLQYMRTVWAVVERVQVVPMDAKVGIPLKHQPMDSLHKKSLGCYWNHCTTTHLMSLYDLNVQPPSTFSC